MTELVAVASDRIAAAINPLGAELWSLTDPARREYMTGADPAFWAGHAPLLFPIVGALRHGCYRIGQRVYQLPRHGFARRSRFVLTAQEPAVARFQLTQNAETLAAYPFAFVLEVEFRAEGDCLRQTVTMTNPGEAPLWFSLGFHPAFAWPLPGEAGKGAHRVRFAEDELGPIRRLDPETGLLLAEAFQSPVRGRELKPDAAQFAADAMIWDRLNSRSLTFGTEDGSRIEMGFPDTPMLGIWQKPGAPFLCLEPWQGVADPADWDGDFRTKPGVVELAEGASRSFRMDVRVVPG